MWMQCVDAVCGCSVWMQCVDAVCADTGTIVIAISPFIAKLLLIVLFPSQYALCIYNANYP